MTKHNFQLFIIALIIIIAVCITGIYILDNVDIPKIDTPSWTPTPTPTPTLSIPIDPKIADIYNNSSNITSWNWTYTEYPNNSNWTYPPEMISNFTFVAGGSGGTSANVSSYVIVVGGGGGAGGAGYTSVAYINSTSVIPVNLVTPTPQETLNASQIISPILLSPIIETWWALPLLFIFPFVLLTMSMRSSTSIYLISLIGLLTFGYFFNWGSTIFMIVSPIFMIVIFMNIIRDTHDR